jgi:hypothetical protein
MAGFFCLPAMGMEGGQSEERKQRIQTRVTSQAQFARSYDEIRITGQSEWNEDFYEGVAEEILRDKIAGKMKNFAGNLLVTSFYGELAEHVFFSSGDENKSKQNLAPFGSEGKTLSVSIENLYSNLEGLDAQGLSEIKDDLKNHHAIVKNFLSQNELFYHTEPKGVLYVIEKETWRAANRLLQEEALEDSQMTVEEKDAIDFLREEEPTVDSFSTMYSRWAVCGGCAYVINDFKSQLQQAKLYYVKKMDF